MGTEFNFVGLAMAATIMVLIHEVTCFSSATLLSIEEAEKGVVGHRNGVRIDRNIHRALASLTGTVHGPNLLVLGLISFLKKQQQQ